jgi:hypothetical protein
MRTQFPQLRQHGRRCQRLGGRRRKWPAAQTLTARLCRALRPVATAAGAGAQGGSRFSLCPPAPQWMAELIGRSQFCVRHQSLGYALNSDNKCLSFCVIAAHRHQGVALHQHETDGTVVLIATLFADMAGRRAFEPSNLQATSLRYHPRMVSGRAMVATSARALRLSR